jgi:hypothetical protein
MTHSFNPPITDRQRQIISGSVLGGSSIVQPNNGVNCYLSMRGKNYNWLYFKMEELKVFSADRSFSKEVTFRWHSKCYPIFVEYRDKFYENTKRKLTLETLENLHLCDIAFAVWFMDCGGLDKDQLFFNTHVWGKEGSEICCEYFKFLNMDAQVINNKHKSKIYFTKDSTQDLLKIIVPVLPYCFVKHLVL